MATQQRERHDLPLDSTGIVTYNLPQQLYTDAAPSLRAFLLNDLALKMAQARKGDPTPYGRESDRIFEKLFERNEKAIALERAGRIDDAIALYEANIADMFDGNHPYDRLRVLYSQRKQYAEALRVCQRFIEMADALLQLGSPRTDLRPKRDGFVEWCRKLETKVQRYGS
jgi:tetratricopeptide (TPR) repeat protein